jgi:hypothetical protein
LPAEFNGVLQLSPNYIADTIRQALPNLAAAEPGNVVPMARAER